MRRFAWVAAAFVVATSTLGAVSLAQTDEPPKADTERPGERYVERLAERLGIPRDQLVQAARDAAKDLVDEAVAAGRLEEERAAHMKERIDGGGLPFHPFTVGPRHRKSPHRTDAGKEVAVDAAAGALGIGREDLVRALRSGTSLDELAREKGKDPAEVRVAIRDFVRRSLDERVESGRLSAEEADRMADRVADTFGTGHHRRPKPEPSPTG